LNRKILTCGSPAISGTNCKFASSSTRQPNQSQRQLICPTGSKQAFGFPTMAKFNWQKRCTVAKGLKLRSLSQLLTVFSFLTSKRQLKRHCNDCSSCVTLNPRRTRLCYPDPMDNPLKPPDAFNLQVVKLRHIWT